jgi:transposase
VAGTTRRESGKFAHTPEAIEAWAAEWGARFPGQPVAVALEQSRGALLYALSKYGHLVLYPIHPSSSYAFRKAMFPSGSKDDPKDADVLLDVLTLHFGRLRALQPDTPQTRKLQALVEKRRQLVDERTAQTNRITDQLKLYFPQVLQWFDEISSPIAAAFLARWPTVPDVKKENSEVLRSFFYQHGSRSEKRINERLQQIQQAVPPIDDTAVIEPAVLVVRILLGVVDALQKGIQALEKSIEETASAHPDYAIFASFPGAGAAMAPRLLAAFGSQRDRYGSAGEMQTFSGIAPVIEASGKKRWIHFRRACPKFVRQTFHEHAALSIQQCDWARTFYDGQRAKGKGHHAAVRALAFKWIRILFRCWQSRQPYDEQLYVAAQQARAVPLTRKPIPAEASSPGQATQSVGGKPSDSQLKSVGAILKSLMANA